MRCAAAGADGEEGKLKQGDDEEDDEKEEEN
jgi:hypothetical protein